MLRFVLAMMIAFAGVGLASDGAQARVRTHFGGPSGPPGITGGPANAPTKMQIENCGFRFVWNWRLQKCVPKH